MKTTTRMVFCAMVITHTLSSQNNNHKVYLEGTYSGGVQQSMPVCGVGGALGIFINTHSSVDLRAKELYNFSNQGMIGPITINYRYNFTSGIYIGGGFAHHHEVSPDSYMNHPMESAMGSERGIFHRSGVNAEVGYNFKPMAKKGFFSGLYPAAGISGTQMLGDHGANPLITANLGIRVGIKKLNK